MGKRISVNKSLFPADSRYRGYPLTRRQIIYEFEPVQGRRYQITQGRELATAHLMSDPEEWNEDAFESVQRACDAIIEYERGRARALGGALQPPAEPNGAAMMMAGSE